MASGGYRPGAGRPKGSKGAAKAQAAVPVEKIVRARHVVAPLDYMLAVMNDADADPVRRDRMAIAAAPFCHARPSESGKRAEAEAQSKVADKNTDWAGLLQ